jgi:hypothetical protein
MAGRAYFMAALSLFICPILCAPLGVVFGLRTYRQGDRTNGALAAILSAVLGCVGTALMAWLLWHGWPSSG